MRSTNIEKGHRTPASAASELAGSVRSSASVQDRSQDLREVPAVLVDCGVVSSCGGREDDEASSGKVSPIMCLVRLLVW